MKLLVYQEAGQHCLGIVAASGVIDVARTAKASGVQAPSVADFYAQGLSALPLLQKIANSPAPQLLEESTLNIVPVVPNPSKILCVGLNYRKHAIETGAKIPETPILFSKFNNSLASDGQPIPLSKYVSQVDYEAELVVVMGKRARDVSEADALNYVLGYCNGNDLSERKLQMTTSQWLLGKTLDAFLPIGRYLVTADEVGDPQNLTIKGWLNGELRQNSNTADMIFSVAQVISYASRYMTLEAGDIISTGTPEGVVLGYPADQRVWLKAGDEYVVEVEKLGRLTNKMVEQ